MSKLYVFGIGGTGSRVLKSLSFLLASGVHCNSDSIVPIIIDPDAANGDVNKTIEQLHLYQGIREKLNFEGDLKNSFFKTKIESISQNYRINIGDSNKKFRDLIGYQELDLANKAMVSLLFSQKNLDLNVEVGFKGNPNMGSVVLNQFNNSEDFTQFASNFSQGDRIFIVSSIFGGTGAAGFPLLLKSIRSASPSLPNHQLLKDSIIGAISVLPYFGVKRDEESEIEKSTFISKTKAALRYYEQGVNNSVNSMYYIGDRLNKDYENNEGSVSQKNDSHFLELASALAIIDFANDNNVDSNKVKEFGVEKEQSSLTFKELSDQTRSQILKPLSKYYFFHIYNNHRLRQNLGADFAQRLELDESFLNQDFGNKLRQFNDKFWEWLKEMDTNERGFSPFNLNPEGDVFDNIRGYKPRRNSLRLFTKYDDYEKITATLNKEARNLSNNVPVETRFMEVFHNSVEKVMTNHIKQ